MDIKLKKVFLAGDLKKNSFQNLNFNSPKNKAYNNKPYAQTKGMGKNNFRRQKHG